MEQYEVKIIREYIQNLYSQTPIGRIEGWRLKMGSKAAFRHLFPYKPTRTVGTYVRSERTVYIQRDLPPAVFTHILAHEMLHVYQHNHNIHSIKSKSEGFCELGGYYTLSFIEAPEAKDYIRAILANQDPIYGEGFHGMLSHYSRGGWDAAIKYLRE